MTDQPFSRPGIAQQPDSSQITQTESVTAMIHLHRGELSESAAWRSRIDTVTSWAVAAVICNTLRGRKLAYPTVDEEKKQDLLKAKAELEANGGPLDPRVDKKAKKQEFQAEREGRGTG